MTGLRRLLRLIATFVENLAWLISTAINHLAILSLAALVAVLAGSAIARYGFHAPLPYTEELSSLLFVSVSFLSLAKVFTRSGHITFGGKSARENDEGRPGRRIAGLVFAAIVLVVLLPPTFDFASLSLQLGARSNVSEILLWPWMSLIPLGLSALLLVIVSQLLSLVLDTSGSRQNDSG